MMRRAPHLVLDGLALWQVRATTVSQQDVVPDGGTTGLRLEGELSPVHYAGSPDPERTGSGAEPTTWPTSRPPAQIGRILAHQPQANPNH